MGLYSSTHSWTVLLAIFNLLAASAIPMRPSAQAFAADSCSDLLVFLLDMNNAPFVIDSVFISLSLIKGAYQKGWLMWFFALELNYHEKL